jgi:hypothetical protein
MKESQKEFWRQISHSISNLFIFEDFYKNFHYLRDGVMQERKLHNSLT